MPSRPDRVVFQTDAPAFAEAILAECESWRFPDDGEPRIWRTPSGQYIERCYDYEASAPTRYAQADEVLVAIVTPSMVYKPPDVLSPPVASVEPVDSPKVKSRSRANLPGTPSSRAVGKAYEFAKAGKKISVHAVCKAAGVDRENLALKYPGAIKAIKMLAAPSGDIRRGTKRNGIADSWVYPGE